MILIRRIKKTNSETSRRIHIFMPDGYDKTFAEMGPEEKNKISMRRIALEKLKKYRGWKKKSVFNNN